MAEIPGITINDLIRVASRESLCRTLHLSISSSDRQIHQAVKKNLALAGFVERRDGVICQLIIDLPVKEHAC